MLRNAFMRMGAPAGGRSVLLGSSRFLCRPMLQTYQPMAMMVSVPLRTAITPLPMSQAA